MPALVRWFLLLALLVGPGCTANDPAPPAESVAQTPSSPAPPSATPVTVGIFQIADHPALDALRDGFKDELGTNSRLAVTYDYMNAGGDGARIETIATHFAASKPALVYTIGTTTAQALKAKAPDQRLLLAAATDPVAAGLVADWAVPGGPITGTTDLPDVTRQLALLKTFVPAARRIGVIYNSGEDNSNAAVALLKRTAGPLGYTVVERTVGSPADVTAAATSLVGEIDTLYVPPDNTMQSALDAALRVADDAKIPVFNCDRSSVERGALFSVGVDYRDIGKVSAQLAGRVLLGEDPAAIPIAFGSPLAFLSAAAAATHGVDVEAVRAQVDEVVQAP